MTTAIIVLIAWALFSRCAYVIFRADHLRDFDFESSDRRFFTGLSLLLGPCALVAAAVIWVAGWADRRAPRPNRVLIHRKGNQ